MEKNFGVCFSGMSHWGIVICGVEVVATSLSELVGPVVGPRDGKSVGL